MKSQSNAIKVGGWERSKCQTLRLPNPELYCIWHKWQYACVSGLVIAQREFGTWVTILPLPISSY